MVAQLRLYTINKGKLQQFVREWKEHVYPLRIAQGFRIPDAWLIEATNQFAWVVVYEGPESWEAKEAAYYASAARAGLDPNPARLIARAEEYFTRPVLI